MKKILIFCLALLTLTSCKDHLADLNTNLINPPEVPAGTLNANATIALFDFMTETSVNVNNFRLWAQQWAQTTYADESNYILTERNVNGRAFITLYTTVLRDIQDAKAFINADELISDENKRNQLAILEVTEIFTWTVLVDIFGDVPYTQALDGNNLSPAYDNDADIYADLSTRLDAAITNLSGSSGVGKEFDLVYGGDVSAWKKMANSLKLRMAIRMADGNATKAKTMVEQAVASGVMASSSDDFELAYQSASPHTNPLWVSLIQSGRSDYVAASKLVDFMEDRADPRLGFFFKDPVTDSLGNTRYQGGLAGDNNSFNQFSHPGTMLENPTLPGTLLDYTEVEFLLADAAARGFIAGDAEAHYDAAVTNSITEWGGSAQEASDYLDRPDVDYAQLTGTWKEKIVMQKWVALYNRGFEAWSSYRMYDVDFLPPAAQAQVPPPRRYTYPVTEFSLNGANVEAAISAIGGDNLDTKVFWDVP